MHRNIVSLKWRRLLMARLFEVERVRDQFPALRRTYKGQQVVYFDGPGGSQVVQSAMDAMVQYMSRGGANLHGVFPSSVETEQMTADTKSTVAAFLNAAADEVAFGPNMTTLNLAISRALSRTWEAGDARKLRQALRDMPGVTVYAAPHPHRKTPTIAFRVDGLTPRQVCEALVEQYGIFVADGDFYATTLADKLGINTSGGWIRAGLAPYNTDDEVDTFIEAMEHVVRART
jgi:selenocysteine lyase/cysteine desulfurase